MGTPLLRLLVLALLLLQGACSSPPTLAPLPPDGVVLAFGDSLTVGKGARPEQSYPAVLAQLIGRDVINAGVSGEVSAAGLARLPALLAAYHPSLVILCHGGNDLLRQRGQQQLADNLRGMVKLARDAGAEVLLVGVPKPALLLSVPDLYADVAEELKVPLEKSALVRLEDDDRFKSDPIHLNAAGYRQLAEAVQAALVKAGAL